MGQTSPAEAQRLSSLLGVGQGSGEGYCISETVVRADSSVLTVVDVVVAAAAAGPSVQRWWKGWRAR